MARQRILEIWQAAIDEGHPEWASLPYSSVEAVRNKTNRYFNGRPCARLHVAPRIARTGHCTTCERTYLRAYASVRRGAEIDATPLCLTDAQKAEIATFYETAARLERETGIPRHVDHVIPLTHPDVCGLHCPWNLQVLTAEENLKKSNKFDGTMENEGWRA